MSEHDPAASLHETAAAFLEILAGDGTGLLELRYRLEDRAGMGQIFDSAAHVRSLATRALRLGRRTDVYVGCAPRTRRHGGRDSVGQAHVLWADCDGPAAVDALRQFRPAPAIVIASGTGENCHAYWPLSAPLDGGEVERANRRLAHAIGADPASTDAARILRVPGTASYKQRPPAAVRPLRLETDRRLCGAEIVGHLRDPPRRAKTGSALSRPKPEGDPLLHIPPEAYVRRLLGVEVPRYRKVSCPFHVDRHPSLHVYETAERGWYCFGRCRRGGTIYDLAAPLFGFDVRGEGFLELRAELGRLFAVDLR